MIGSSVVPGLPNRWVMPSSFSKARNAERPVMRFFMSPPARGALACGMKPHDQTWMAEAMDQGHGCPGRANSPTIVSGTLEDQPAPLKHPLLVDALLLFRALPDHAGKPFQRH